MAEVLARAVGVTCRFGEFTAVDEVSMEVCAGEVVGLIGANGAGKTTLIRMLLGLQTTSAGSVQLLGGPPDRERRARLGYVPQTLGLYRDLTVAENVSFVARSYRTRAPTLPASIARSADLLVRDLPLGTQRQIAFITALSHSPEVLILDEPTSGVDALIRASLWDTIREHSDRGIGLLVTTHYMQEAQQCDRLLLMSGGRLIATGSEAEIIGSTTAAAVHSNDWSRAFAVLNHADLPVMLVGRSVRVAGGNPDELERLLAAAGIRATVETVVGTLEERMLLLAYGSAPEQ